MYIEDYGVFADLKIKRYTSARYFHYETVESVSLDALTEEVIKECIKKHGVCYIDIREHGKTIVRPHTVSDKYRDAFRMLEKVKRELLS